MQDTLRYFLRDRDVCTVVTILPGLPESSADSFKTNWFDARSFSGFVNATIPDLISGPR